MGSVSGVTNYPYWNPSDKASAPGNSNVDFGAVSIPIFCTFNTGDGIGIAYVEGGYPSTMRLYARYLSADGLTVSESYTVTLPYNNVCVGIKQISKYSFRLLIGDNSSRVWRFYLVNAIVGTYTVESSYTFTRRGAGATGWITEFVENSRSGDYIFGYDQEDISPWGITLYGIVANIGNATFGTLTKMWYFIGSGAIGADTQHGVVGSFTISHDGNNGFLIRLIRLDTWLDDLIPNYPRYTWFLTHLKVTLYTWAGFDISEGAGVATVLDEITYSPPEFLFHYSGWPYYRVPSGGTATLSESDGYTRPHNSFYYYNHIYVNMGGDTFLYEFNADTAYPLSCGNTSAYSATIGPYYRPLTETGNLLGYCGFEKGSDNYFYLTNYLTHACSLISYTGYDIKTVFNRLDTYSGNILCWAKRVSDGHFGVLEFTEALVFSKFTPIIDTAYEVYGLTALISNGFIVIPQTSSAWHCYYIGNFRGNKLRMIIEQN